MYYIVEITPQETFAEMEVGGACGTGGGFFVGSSGAERSTGRDSLQRWW
jgi:hypothetical protein